jgi:hypothetical protein
VPGLGGGPPATGLLVAGGSLGGGVVGAVVDVACVGCGAGLDGRAVGFLVGDGVEGGLAEGERLGVEAYVLKTNGDGDGLCCRTCLCTGCFTGAAGACGAALPASAVVPITRPATAPPTALMPATVSEPLRPGPP